MKKRWACIYINPKGQIYQIRVTDGDYVSTIPVSNSNLKTCKQTIKSMYGKCEILISQEIEGGKQ